MIETKEQCPWIDYLEIDEDTLEHRLRDDTPQNIREAYNAYLDEVESYKKKWIQNLNKG